MDADLEALVEQCSGPIDYGIDDCVPFCVDLILVQTGDDLFSPERGSYSSKEERDALLDERGLARRMFARMDGRKGWRRVRPREAMQPAIGLATVGPDLVCCVAVANGYWATRSTNGVAVFLAADVRRAWQWG